MEIIRRIMILVTKLFLIITIGIIVTIFFFLIQIFIVNKPIDVSTIMERDFSVEIPNPDKKHNAFSDSIMFGEGESYFIYTYSDKCFNQVKKSNVGTLIHEKNMGEIEDNIKFFIKETIDIHMGEEKYKKLFEKNPIIVEVGDRFIYKKMDKGYQILLIKINESKIYHLRMGKSN